jgi:hypothetical protein
VRTVLRVLAVLAVPCVLSSGCSDSFNYDIEEVAPAEFLSGEEECHDPECADASHDHEHGEEDHDHAVDEHTHGEEDHDHAEAGDLEHDLGLHTHGAGVRNHGTQWFFNQPWAASFVWGKMLRDSIILLVLALIAFFLPRLARRR